MGDTKTNEMLRSQIYHWIDQFKRKPEDSRTKLESLLLQSGQTFADLMARYAEEDGSDGSTAKVDVLLEGALRGFNLYHELSRTVKDKEKV